MADRVKSDLLQIGLVLSARGSGEIDPHRFRVRAVGRQEVGGHTQEDFAFVIDQADTRAG